MKDKLSFIKTWEASGNGVFEPDMIVAKAYKSVFASYRPKHFLYYQKNNRNKLGEAYDVQEEMDKFNKSGFKDFQNNNYLKTYFKGISVAINHNKRVTKVIEKNNLDTISKTKLAQLFELSIESMKINFSYFLACQPQRFTRLEQAIKDKLSKSVSETETDEVFRVLSTPTESTPVGDEQIDWHKLILKIKKERIFPLSEEFDEIVKKHHKKYAILGAADGKDPWSINHFIDTARKDKRSISAIQSEIKNISSRKGKLEKQQKNFIKNHKINREIRHLCSLLAKVGHRRLSMRIQGWMPLYEVMKKVIRAVARRYSYDPELIRFCTVDELINITKGEVISRDLLAKRKNLFLLIYKYPNTRVFHGQEADKKFKELVPREDFEKMKEVKGTIAMKGKIVGRVLLFQWGDDMSEKVKKIKGSENIILVTGQTRPQLMPLIVKCSAIVTDEGGITSHSAIVSRELGIPCIVGTRIGTRIFKDGDRVEVDANSGVVRILSLKSL